VVYISGFSVFSGNCGRLVPCSTYEPRWGPYKRETLLYRANLPWSEPWSELVCVTYTHTHSIYETSRVKDLFYLKSKRLFTAREASWRRALDPCTPHLFDLYHCLQQNGYFGLVPENPILSEPGSIPVDGFMRYIEPTSKESFTRPLWYRANLSSTLGDEKWSLFQKWSFLKSRFPSGLVCAAGN